MGGGRGAFGEASLDVQELGVAVADKSGFFAAAGAEGGFSRMGERCVGCGGCGYGGRRWGEDEASGLRWWCGHSWQEGEVFTEAFMICGCF